MLTRILLLLFLVSNFSNCKSAINRKNKATQQLNSLKSGALLVRLPTNEAKIAKLKKMGKSKQAKEEVAFLKKFHTQILAAFYEHFDYCPVYFYFSNHSKEIMNRNFNGHLFDAKKNEVDNFNVPDENLLYGEFGKVHEIEATSTKNGEDVKVAGFGGKDAFVIRDKQGLQPAKPFPYSVDYKSPFYRALSQSIASLNSRLFATKARMERRKMRRIRKGKE